MFIQRHLGKTIQRALQTFPAVVITGPRQSGKTRLLKEKWGQSHRFLSLEDPDIRSLAKEDPRTFLNQNRPPVIFDEVQYQADLLPYIKTRIDEHREKSGQWLLTGSQQFSMMKGVTESLAGRAAILNLLPLSLAEIQGRKKTLVHFLNVEHLKKIKTMEKPSHKISKEMLANWLLRGSYPELYEKPEIDRRLWFGSYLQTYLERDVRNLTQVGDLADFEKFLRLIAVRTGQILQLQEVAKEVGVSLPTAKRWLSILEASFLVYLLRPYYRNFGKRLIKSSKIYFLDVGLACYLRGLHSAEHLLASPAAGSLFETAIVSELVKGYYNEGLIPPLYFWRSHDQLEVDLIVEDNLQLIPIEIKLTATLSPEHLRSLKKWQEVVQTPVKEALLLCQTPAIQEMTQGIWAYPWHLI